MAAEVFEETVELEIGLIEAELPSPTSGENHRASYPYPFLHATGESSRRAFRAVVLENPFLRVTVLPALGGRILGIHDRRTNRDIIPLPESLRPIARGPRGATVPDGIQIRLRGEDRLNSLGLVDTMPDEDRAGVWIAETGGDGSSFHGLISLTGDRAELTIEVRAFNRLMRPIPYSGGLIADVGQGLATKIDGGVAWYDTGRDAGLALRTTRTPFDFLSYVEGRLELARFEQIRELSPRQLDVWTVVLTPLSGLGGLSGVGQDVAGWLDDRVVRLQTCRQAIGAKLVLLTKDSQTLEAPADLYPERPFEMSLGNLPSPPQALVLLDADRNELMRLDRASLGDQIGARKMAAASAPAPDSLSRSMAEADLLRATFDPARRHVAYLLLAAKASAEGRYLDADRDFEQALLFDAEDHLGWWAKAVMARLKGDDAEEAAELLNAHFLAPLEPALRAEGFLSQSAMMGKEPSAVLKPLAESPEEFVEVACLLLDLGLFDQATRWIDEALRHVDLPMLRYLLAYSYLSASRMSVEAAEQVSAAARKPIAPPFPWRAVEGLALRALVDRFPQDERLAGFLELYDRFASESGPQK